MKRVKLAYDRLIHRALAMGGTCTGEHGIGSGKRAYLALEHGPALATMQAIKRALDPLNIMTPGSAVLILMMGAMGGQFGAALGLAALLGMLS